MDSSRESMAASNGTPPSPSEGPLPPTPIPRLVDYVAIVDLDPEQFQYDTSSGIVSQRFPDSDWDDVAFSNSIQVFCQPWGWRLWIESEPAKFFVNVLTSMDGSRQYACCLQMQERCSERNGFEQDMGSTSTFYKPKVYVILSRHAFFRLFMMSLRKLSIAHLEGRLQEAENMVVTLLSGGDLVSGSPYSFSLDSERFTVNVPKYSSIPMSTGSASILARCLGLHNLLQVMRAVLSDQKIVFISSYCRMLTSAAHAVQALLYPLEYAYTCVPVLPEPMLEYLESPTPFLMGILRGCADGIDREGIVVVDLDTGAVEVPMSIRLPEIPDPFGSRLVHSLQSVLLPELKYIDVVDAPPIPPKPDDEALDSQLRACFVRFYADLMEGYRCALQLVRLFPSPLIAFHRSAYMGMRALKCDGNVSFLKSFFDNHMFQLFISTRGLPYRTCDIFDTFVSTTSRMPSDQKHVTDNRVRELATQIYNNERQSEMISATRLRSVSMKEEVPREAAQNLDEKKIASSITSNLAARASHSTGRVHQKTIVPETPLHVRDDECEESRRRRFQALEESVAAIFENRIAEARRTIPAIEFALRTQSVRVRLCAILVKRMHPVHNATLHPQQFELLVRLINVALEQESVEDEHGIAYASLHFSYVYCRSLTQGVQQYAYTCIQEHAVWENERFWETAFFHDIHRLMRHQYMPNTPSTIDGSDLNIKGLYDTWGLMEEPTAMQLAARKLQETKSEADMERLVSEEESIVFGQAKHFINLMVFLRIPLDTSRLQRIEKEKEQRSKMRQDSTDDSDAESGFVEKCNVDMSESVTKWITRVTDRISSAAGIPPRSVDQLTKLIGPCVEMHIDTIEQVYRESSKLPPPPKMEVEPPELLPHEVHLVPTLRAFLLPDERPHRKLQCESISARLPAEGLLALTNYRFVFKGHPANPLAADEVVIRAIPVMAVTKEKFRDDVKTGSWQMHGIPTKISSRTHSCVQIRSSTFSTITVVFDEEVTAEAVAEMFRRFRSVRWCNSAPSTLLAYAAQAHLLHFQLEQQRESRMSSMKEFKKVFKQLPKSIPGSLARRKMESLDLNIRSNDSPNRALTEEYLDMDELVGRDRMTATSEYLVDLRRLRLAADSGHFRRSEANTKYSVCQSYPSRFVIPSSVSDSVLPKIAKGFKGGRFPVVTWTHERGALLIRGSSFLTPNVVSMMKKQAKDLSSTPHRDHSLPSHRPSDSSSPITSSAHQVTLPAAFRRGGSVSFVSSSEHYIRRLVIASPSATGDINSLASLGYSSESLHSSAPSSVHPTAMDPMRRNTNDALRNANLFIRNSSTRSSTVMKTSVGASSISIDDLPPAIDKAKLVHRSLYVFGDKANSKALRFDRTVDFVPLPYPTAHDMKDSFKKFTKALRSEHAETPGKSIHAQIDESGYIHHISTLLQQSSCMATLLSAYNSSVLLAIEDGSDATCQIASLVQILADPHYRTIKGFQQLICKEWLSLGHRFSHRSNQSTASQKSGFAPVFLLFLDCVHQIMAQFPSAFQFNDFLIRFIAYHSQSGRFRTFVKDNEMERAHIEGIVPDLKAHHCIFRFIEDQQEERPIFTNFLYDPLDTPPLLDVRWHIASMDLWEYYTEDFIAHGPPYDIEIALSEKTARDEEMAKRNENKTTRQKGDIVEAEDPYACKDLTIGNGFSSQLERFSQISTLLVRGKEGPSWKQCMQKLEMDKDSEIPDHVHRKLGTASHAARKNVLKYLMDGRNVIGRTPQSMPPPFTPVAEVPERTGSISVIPPSSEHSTLKTNGVTPRPSQSSQQAEEPTSSPAFSIKQFSRKPSYDTSTIQPIHSGTLCKKGATFKFWKPRWFILDQKSRKMYYMDSPMDTEIRGDIDLHQLHSIIVSADAAHVPRRGTAVIEIRTTKRTFSLLANSKAEADEWQVKIESLL